MLATLRELMCFIEVEKRCNMTIIDAYPKLLGIGIDEKAAIVVTGDRFRVIGKGRVAIYDNKKQGNNCYYWLNTGDVFNLRTRSKETAGTG